MRGKGALWLTLAAGAAMLALYLAYPLTGDDYAYANTFRTVDGFDGPWPLERFYRWYPFHWLRANGRLANFFAMCSLTFLPKWLTAIVMGAATWGWMALVLRLGDAWRGRLAAAAGAVFYMAAVFPWWDLMYTVDFNFNYPVAACAGLGAVWIWRRYGGVKRRWMRWLCLAAAAAGGAFHESMGAPLLGAGVWLLWRRGGFAGAGIAREPFAAFAAGVAVAFSSPGIWGRAAADRVADAPLFELLLCSAPLTLGAMALFAALCLSRRWRRWMAAEAGGWWGFWMAASLGALLFCAAGGIIGRSGWFSQTFALIALLLWGKELRPMPRIAAACTAALGAAGALFFAWAPMPEVIAMARAEGRAREALAKSADGVVRVDMPREGDQPWWTLKRVRVLDPDDYYLHQVVADYYKKPRFLILPERLDSGALTRQLPPGAVPLDPGTFDAPEPERFAHTDSAGRQTIYQLIPSPTPLYHASPRHRDPGDR